MIFPLETKKGCSELITQDSSVYESCYWMQCSVHKKMYGT